MKPHTFWTRFACTLVAIIAGAASWSHIASVAYGAGEAQWVAYSLPAAIDGLIVVGVAALLEDRHKGRRPRMSARVAVLVGVLATLAANIASAQPTWTARLVAVCAPVAFMLCIEVLTRTGRKVEDAVATPTEWLAAASDDELLDAWLAARPAPATPEIETEPAPDPAPPAEEVPKVKPVKRARAKPRHSGGKASAAEKVSQARQRYPGETQKQIAKRTGVGLRSVARYWHANGSDPKTGHDAAELATPEPNNQRHDDVPDLAPVGGET